ETTAARLAANGSLRMGTERIYAVGGLALVWRTGINPPAGLESVSDPVYETIAIANPEIAPYGAAAREALRAVGVLEAVESRIVRGENIAQTYQFVRTGNADLAIVARSVVDTAQTAALSIDPALHPPLRQA